MYNPSNLILLQVYFIIGTWVVYVLLWILTLGQSKVFYFSYGMMDRVGRTCATSSSFFVFKTIFTFLADYTKMMIVYMYSSEFWSMAIYFNLIYVLPLIFPYIWRLFPNLGIWVVHVLLWILILGEPNLQSKLFYFIYGPLAWMSSTCPTPHMSLYFKSFS